MQPLAKRVCTAAKKARDKKRRFQKRQNKSKRKAENAPAAPNEQLQIDRELLAQQCDIVATYQQNFLHMQVGALCPPRCAPPATHMSQKNRNSACNIHTTCGKQTCVDSFCVCAQREQSEQTQALQEIARTLVDAPRLPATGIRAPGRSVKLQDTAAKLATTQARGQPVGSRHGPIGSDTGAPVPAGHFVSRGHPSVGRILQLASRGPVSREPPQTKMTARVNAVRTAKILSLEEVATDFSVINIPLSGICDRQAYKRGGYGEIEQGVWETRSVIVKKFFGELGEKHACRELAQSQLGKFCPFVVPPLGYSRDELKPVLIYEYGGKTLASHLQSTELKDPLNTCALLCHCVDSFHTKAEMVHLDLKSNNVLYGEAGFRLIDLGLAQPLRNAINPYHGVRKSIRHWMGPEFNSAPVLTRHADTYALGFMLLEVLLPGEDHKAPPAPGKITKVYPAELEQSVMRCFAKEPTHRPAIPDLERLFQKFRCC